MNTPVHHLIQEEAFSEGLSLAPFFFLFHLLCFGLIKKEQLLTIEDSN
jgi:hypothetical protein